jgi:hypothetical protein
MVRDSQFDLPSLDPETIALLRDAMGRCLDDGADVESVRPALQRVAREARERRILAEQLLVSLKDIWYDLPQVRRSVRVEEQQLLLQRLVTLSIREYYAQESR